jgi:ADP-ribosylglycohydrolase
MIIFFIFICNSCISIFNLKKIFHHIPFLFIVMLVSDAHVAALPVFTISSGHKMSTNMSSLLKVFTSGAVGDFLGSPYKKTSSESSKWLVAFLNGKFNNDHTMDSCSLSDDTQMTITALSSIAECSGFDLHHMRDSFVRDAHTYVGLGKTTRQALEMLRIGAVRYQSDSVGNGTVMRAAPMLLVKDWRTSLVSYCALTHTSVSSITGAAIHLLALETLLKGWRGFCPTPGKIRKHLLGAVLRELQRLSFEVDKEALGCLEAMLEDAEAPFCPPSASVGPDGVFTTWTGLAPHAVATSLAALHFFLRHPASWKRGLLDMIRYGGDTDTGSAALLQLYGAHGMSYPSDSFVQRLIPDAAATFSDLLGVSNAKMTAG